MITVEVSAAVHPTEDTNRVRAAIESLFPRLEFTILEREGMTTRLVGSGRQDSLDTLHRLLRSQKILDTARTRMIIDKNTVTFVLNKQAATAGKVSFPPDEEPLGSIWVEIAARDNDMASKVVDWLAPPTENGRPQFEIEL